MFLCICVRGKRNCLLSFKRRQTFCEHTMNPVIGVATQHEALGCFGQIHTVNHSLHHLDRIAWGT